MEVHKSRVSSNFNLGILEIYLENLARYAEPRGDWDYDSSGEPEAEHHGYAASNTASDLLLFSPRASTNNPRLSPLHPRVSSLHPLSPFVSIRWRIREIADFCFNGDLISVVGIQKSVDHEKGLLPLFYRLLVSF